ncbi:hypothetical protein AVEN_253908-1 [Araneus ventricosus]|uniref:Uncharacterized protein n=1 Tax=Araneus ventricosus TaxID=182803 RepID=A0A4Y2EN08_ARAVE|nr:hypothetical protein AVEN_253908-1 [Araneus ventricosus]
MTSSKTAVALATTVQITCNPPPIATMSGSPKEHLSLTCFASTALHKDAPLLAQDSLQYSYDIFTMLCGIQNIVATSWKYPKISCANRTPVPQMASRTSKR